jgi:cytochrome c
VHLKRQPPEDRERGLAHGRFCSSVKQPATTTDYFPRPTICAQANGGHMTKLRTIRTIGLGFCAALPVVTMADAQMPLPAARPPDGATLFKQQCATCHTTNSSDPARQGPSLFRIVGRPAGKADGFRYSAGFTKADFVWDDIRLDAYLANPQAMVPGSVMAYRQPKAETRAAIIAYLKELN